MKTRLKNSRTSGTIHVLMCTAHYTVENYRNFENNNFVSLIRYDTIKNLHRIIGFVKRVPGSSM